MKKKKMNSKRGFLIREASFTVPLLLQCYYCQQSTLLLAL